VTVPSNSSESTERQAEEPLLAPGGGDAGPPPAAETVPEERPQRFIRDVAVSLFSLAVVAGGIFAVQFVRNRDSAQTATAAAVGLPSGDYTAVRLGVVAGGDTKIGGPAPVFQLSAPDGQMFRLSDLRGKVALVNFWATWCAPCRQEIPDLVRLQKDWGDSVRIVGVDLQETPADVAAFATRLQMNYSLALDFNGEVASSYKVRGLPTTFFLDAQGIVRDLRIGVLRPQVATCIVNDIERGKHDPGDCR
jgi:cytochrome c biogenesis protein CcmG, thiol:disulfide interchange protein DsbE